MAKFNKDRFFNNITEKVQSAINAHLITDEDYDNNDMEKLHSCIQYLLVENVEDRKFAIDVLDDFDYDDKDSWENLESQFGQFTSLMDIALVDLWKFLEEQGATEYSYYHKSGTSKDTPLLNIAHSDEKNDNPRGGDQKKGQFGNSKLTGHNNGDSKFKFGTNNVPDNEFGGENTDDDF